MTKETRTRIAEKVHERRMSAHEAMLDQINRITLMNLLDENVFNEDAPRFPYMFQNSQAFDLWYGEFVKTYSANMQWFGGDAIREVNLFQDYLLNLSFSVRAANETTCKQIGVLVRQDFIDFAENLGKLIRTYFKKGVFSVTAQDMGDWTKYDRSTADERINRTAFWQNRLDIQQMIEDQN